MVTHVAVVDPLPIYRQGVLAVLSAVGHTVEMPPDVLAWVRHGLGRIVLLTLLAESDWHLLDKLREASADHFVIGVIAENSAMDGVRAVRTGARSVLARQASVDTLRRTVEATLDGQSVLPTTVLKALTTGAWTDLSPSPLSTHQLAWLGHLAAGDTVAQLATRVGYSERAMFRLLRMLYKEIGVQTRTQAILRAQERGWLRPRTEPTVSGSPAPPSSLR